MGVEYRHYLVPERRSFRPSGASLIELISALRDAGFLPTPKLAASGRLAYGNQRQHKLARKSGAHVRRPGDDFRKSFSALPVALEPEFFDIEALPEAIITFPIQSDDYPRSGLRYPLVPDWAEERDVYYDLELRISDDFQCCTSEQMQHAPGKCVCGAVAQASYFDPVFYAGRIPRACQTCGAELEPSGWPATYREPFGLKARARAIQGGLVMRFAIVIDTGKMIPDSEHGITAARELVRLASATLEVGLVEFSEIH
jgi:hypothetical protein